jgi:transcriptional regulator of acetoin/glycerol metabolism
MNTRPGEIPVLSGKISTKMNITEKAKILITLNSKVWLAEKLGIQRTTLDNRLKKSNWKKTEIQMIISLSK